MIEVGQFFELRLSALKEEGQPKLATLFAFGCEPVTICAVGTILPVATVSPFLSAEETFQVKWHHLGKCGTAFSSKKRRWRAPYRMNLFRVRS
jgi:hypothetical protein